MRGGQGFDPPPAAPRAAGRSTHPTSTPTRSPRCGGPTASHPVRAVRGHHRAPQEPVRPCSTPSPVSTVDGVDLVLVGPDGWNEEGDALLGSAGSGSAALGFVSEHDKAALYAGADVFCYPSVWEGFGLPVLEALAQGAPVVTSRGTATEEVAGDAALLVDPHDPVELADALASVLDDPTLAARPPAGRGPARAADVPVERRPPSLLAEAFAGVPEPPDRERPASASTCCGSCPASSGAPRTHGAASSPSCARQRRRRPRHHPLRAARLPCTSTPTWWRRFPGRRGSRSAGRRKPTRVLAEATVARRLARRDRLELVHHCGGTCCARATVPSVVTIHDVQPIAFPEQLRPRSSRRGCGTMLPRSVRAARLVVTLSEHTRHDVVELHGRAARSHLRVVPPGIAAASPPAPSSDEAPRCGTPTALDDRPYFALPGHHLPPQEPPARSCGRSPSWPVRPSDVPLVLPAGAARGRGGLHGRDRRASASATVSARPGRVPRADLDVLIDGATVLAFPSSLEGFGMPVLEAMSRGLPGDRVGRDRASPRSSATPACSSSPTTPTAGPTRCSGCSTTPTSGPSAGRRGLAPRPASSPWERSVRGAAGAAVSTSPVDRSGPVKAARAVPALRARRGAHRRGDDQHRRRAGRARPPPPRGHVAALVPAPPRSSPAGTGQLVHHDDTSWGTHHPRPPVPHRQAQHPGPGRGLRRLHRRSPPSSGR